MRTQQNDLAPSNTDSSSMMRKSTIQNHKRSTSVGKKQSKRKLQSSAVDSENDTKPYTCDVCHQTFILRTYYDRHIERHKPPGGFVCSVCEAKFTSHWDRAFHKQNVHSVFRCRICKYEVSTEKDYNEHIRTVHDGKERDYDMCPQCGQQFISQIQLKLHIDSKCGREKKHQCKICGEHYMSSTSLGTHMMTHKGEKSHLCNYCGASFLNRGQLKIHERTHTGEKPYKCTQCEKAFAHRESLITHSSIHTGIKPYYCSLCEKRFSCVGNLIKHRRARLDTCGLPEHSMPSLADCPRLPKVIQSGKRVRTAGKKSTAPADVCDEVEVEPRQSTVVKENVAIKVEKMEFAGEANEVNRIEDQQETDGNVDNVEGEVDMIEYYDASEENDALEMNADSDGQDMLEDNDSQHDTVQTYVIKVEKNDEVSIQLVDVKMEETIEQREPLGLSIVEIEPSPDADADADADTLSLSTSEDMDLKDDDDDIIEPKQKEASKVTERTTPNANRRRWASINGMLPEHEKRSINAQLQILKENHEKVSIDCYRCKQCPMQYTSEYLLARHLEREHQLELSYARQVLQQRKTSIREKRYHCKYCLKLYSSQQMLQKHVALHGPSGLLLHKCPCCPRYYETTDQMRNHALEVHRNKLECPVCGRLFKDTESMQGHVRYTHDGLKHWKKFSHVCPKCGKNFSSRTAVTDHERAKCGKKPIYECETCHKFYQSAGSLKAHQSIHSDQLPYSCQYCGRSYRTKGQTKIHERSHNGEKPFVCDFCNKAFAHRETLYTHRSVHTGVKRFKCKSCDLRFTCISNLQAHRRARRSTCGQFPLDTKRALQEDA